MSQEHHRPGPTALVNAMSLIGAALTIFSATAVVFFLVLGLLSPDSSAYGGLTLVPLAAALGLGLTLVGAGLLRERRRRSRGLGPSLSGQWSFDLRRIQRRQVAATIVLGGMAVSFGILASGAGALRVVEYTGSNDFCANMCHSVMHPEATVYPRSAHARIECVECHVGHGAESFIRSKLAGMRQVLAVAAGRVQRPIPTPIRTLRPSREMCETCHWSDRLIDYKVLPHSYFRADAASSPRGVRMMVKIGGGEEGMLEGAGIHYHMLVAQKVEYIARDPQHQDIPWVRATRSGGEVVVYEHLENPLSESEKESLEIRTMECLDCHNRPAHRFAAPIERVNYLLATGKLPRDLPRIKRESVQALDGGYATSPQAMQGIADSLRAFYREKHPKLLEERSEDIERVIETLRDVYRETVFPEMKADWRAHPDNIGHLNWPGCFRCHNYEMESEDGETIFRSCTSCHVILAQIDPEAGSERLEMVDFSEGTLFLHPDGDEAMENQTVCSDCHDGGFRLYREDQDERAELPGRPASHATNPAARSSIAR